MKPSELPSFTSCIPKHDKSTSKPNVAATVSQEPEPRIPADKGQGRSVSSKTERYFNAGFARIVGHLRRSPVLLISENKNLVDAFIYSTVFFELLDGSVVEIDANILKLESIKRLICRAYSIVPMFPEEEEELMKRIVEKSTLQQEINDSMPVGLVRAVRSPSIEVFNTGTTGTNEFSLLFNSIPLNSTRNNGSGIVINAGCNLRDMSPEEFAVKFITEQYPEITVILLSGTEGKRHQSAINIFNRKLVESEICERYTILCRDVHNICIVGAFIVKIPECKGYVFKEDHVNELPGDFPVDGESEDDLKETSVYVEPAHVNSGGFVGIRRRFFKSAYFTTKYTEYVFFMLDLYQIASFRDAPFRILGTNKVIPLRRGQLVASNRFLKDRWNVSGNKVSTFLRKAEDETLLETEIVNGITVITLMDYQGCDSKKECGRTGAETDRGTETETGMGQEWNADEANIRKDNKAGEGLKRTERNGEGANEN